MRSSERGALRRLLGAGVVLLPAAFVLAYAFEAGGYFPSATAAGVVVLGTLLLTRIVVDRRGLPVDRPLAVALGALALLAVWTLLSAAWSGAGWRALVEFDRVVLYLLALALFGSLATAPARALAIARALTVAATFVCLAALLARLLPDVYPLAADFDGYGLAYPVTYANTLGLLAVVGLVLCLHLTSATGEARVTRLLAAAAVPPLAATLVLTGSRGAALAGAVGLAVLVVAARPRALATALLATVPTAALAAVAAGGAGALAGASPAGPGALAEGREVAIVVALSAANAALLRGLLLRFGARIDLAARTLAEHRAVVVVGALALLAAAVISAGASFFGSDRASEPPSPAREAASNGAPEPASARPDHWLVALEAFAAAPLAGHGAGAYETESRRARGTDHAVRDAHSLPLELLAELGVVGFGLATAGLAALAMGLVAGLRGAHRALFGMALAVAATWLVHASIDWDWEMPVVTLPVFALCGAALATRRPSGVGAAPLSPKRPDRPPLAGRIVLAIVVTGLVAVAGLIAFAAR